MAEQLFTYQMLSGWTGDKCCLTPSLGKKRVDIRGGLLGK